MPIQALLRQTLGALDMLSNAFTECPPDLWEARLWQVKDGPADASAFWYHGYHTLFWLDLYLDGTPEGFAPPAPFNLDELDAAFVLPSRVYTKDELHVYLAHGRSKCVSRVGGLDDVAASTPSGFAWLPCSYFEVQLYNLRHIQEHTSQLNMFLGQSASKDAKWVKFGSR